MNPFSINIFVPSGDLNGLRIARRDQWTGRAVVCSRDQVHKLKTRPEYNFPGVFVLTGAETFLAGHGDPAGPCLEKLAKGPATWRRAVLLVSDNGSLHKAHLPYLEA